MHQNNNFKTLPFAALTVEQAKEIIGELVSEEIKKITPKTPEKPKSDLINIDAAVLFLQEHGYYIKKSSLYNLVNTQSIPFRKIGRRVIFSRLELAVWVEEKSKMSEPDYRSKAAITLAESANRKK